MDGEKDKTCVRMCVRSGHKERGGGDREQWNQEEAESKQQRSTEARQEEKGSEMWNPATPGSKRPLGFIFPTL